MAIEQLSTHIKFNTVPIQARKCHLANVIHISNEQTVKAIDLSYRSIVNQISTFYIHDNIESLHLDSAACTLQTQQMQIDLSSLLISLGLVQYNTHAIGQSELLSAADKFQLEKRLRKKSDDAMQKPSCQLQTIDDFKEFYDVHKTYVAVKPMVCVENDDGNQTFDVLKAPSRRNPFGRAESAEIQMPAHPMVDCIIEHFSLLKVTQSKFYCRPVFIVDPLTVLVVVGGEKPPKIQQIQQQTKYFPMDGLFLSFHSSIGCDVVM